MPFEIVRNDIVNMQVDMSTPGTVSILGWPCR